MSRTIILHLGSGAYRAVTPHFCAVSHSPLDTKTDFGYNPDMLTPIDLLDAPPPPKASDYLIYPWLQPGRLLLMVGPTEIGKTTLTLEMISECLRGGLLWGRYPTKGIKRVLYLHGEHSIHTVQEAAQKRGDIPPGSVFVIHDFGPNGSALTDGTKANITLINELMKVCDVLKPELIIAEPISAFISNSENDNKEARQVINILCAIGAKYNAAILTHHHVGKAFFDPERVRPLGVPTGEARGSMAFEDAAERVIYLRREKDDTKIVRIETPKPKGYPIATIRVARDEETLRYHPLNPTHPEYNMDISGLFGYRLMHPDHEWRKHVVPALRSLWKTRPNTLYSMGQRCINLGLFAEDFSIHPDYDRFKSTTESTDPDDDSAPPDPEE